MPGHRMVPKTAFALSLLTVAAWACARSPESPGAMLMDRMRQLAQAPALTFELIQETLEVAFAKDAGASHDMVTFYAGAPRPGSALESLIKLVDCRVPTPQNTALKEPFVVVELQEAGGGRTTSAEGRPAPLSAGDIVAKYGQPDSFDPALPEDSETWGNYIYKLGPRSLWVSLGRQNPDKIRGFSIHPLEDVRRP